MTTPKWQSGHLYLPGDLVQPQQAQPAAQSALTNPGFESGDTTGWTITQSGGTGTPSVATDKKFAGTYAGRWQGAAGTGHSGGVEAVWENATDAPVTPGQSIAASVMFKLDDTDSSQNQAQARLHWYNASSALISTTTGTLIRGNDGSWRQSVVTGSAPAGAATVRLAAWTTANTSGGVRLDNATWNHVAPPTTAGLIYKAVQEGPGTSAETEPDWPTTLGVQVIDNTVTWEAVTTSRVVWEASPILTSGATEPDWPTTPGDFVSDGTIKWECVSRRVEDENCPNSKVVAILASKVFAGDGDIVRFSATANPLDWTSEQDAGYLPTGLQQANANDMAVLNQYRSNLVAFNASSFQNWQADPDPAAMAILDQMDGIGSTWPRAAQAVSNELLFLSQLGVRSVSIAAGAENLAAGDIGSPIDELVRAAIAVDDVVPIATYYPGAGQYWLAMGATPQPNVLTISGDLPDATIGEPASLQYGSTGGRLPKTFSVIAGALPDGVEMDTSGRVSGAYNAAGDYSWTVQVTDADSLTAQLPDTASVTGTWWNPADRINQVSYYAELTDSTRLLTPVNTDAPNNHTLQARGYVTRSVANGGSGNLRYFEVELARPAPTSSTAIQVGVLGTAVALDESLSYNAPSSSLSVGAASGNDLHYGSTASIASNAVSGSAIIGVLVDIASGMTWYTIDGAYAVYSGLAVSPANFPTTPPFGAVLPPGTYAPFGGVNAVPQASPIGTLRLRQHSYELEFMPDGALAWASP